RSVAAVKIALTKNGGNMGEAGTVGWMFEKNGVIVAKCENEDAELMAIDAGADDISMEEGVFEIITDYRNLMKVKDALKEKGFEIEKAEISFIPKDTLILDNLEDAKKAIQLMEALEDEEDVAEVYCNFDIAEELLDQL
ncbi:YebC/PmpR family DNA-binding transcriptional regulator, partial [Candidatus Gracilibacteria bacterium]|nr:YebC/PmpR family DNA-binding transcriptional regulator [Candidatus Gracilibacteria bacterium]